MAFISFMKILFLLYHEVFIYVYFTQQKMKALAPTTGPLTYKEQDLANFRVNEDKMLKIIYLHNLLP